MFGLVLIVFALLSVVWSWLLLWRNGVYLDDIGITARSSFAVRRIPWADIDSFASETGPFGIASFMLDLDPGDVRGYVNLRNGSRIRLSALKPVRRRRASRTRSELDWTIVQLNMALAPHHSTVS